MKSFEVGQSVKVKGVGHYPGEEPGDRWQVRVGQTGKVVSAIGPCLVSLRFDDGETVAFEPVRDDLEVVA